MRVIAGRFKRRRLKAPTWEGLRPTSDKLRETLFNILAPRIAVFLHGAAGDLAEASEGQVAMVATDVIAHLGDALNQLCNPDKESS